MTVRSIRGRRVAAIGGIVALTIAIWFAVGFSSAQRACAHDPRFPCSPRTSADPVRVPDPAKSWAYYGHLTTGQHDVYAMPLSAATDVPWNLLVDERDAGNPARPTATLTAGDGRIVKTIGFSSTDAFYEPFSREHYVESPAVILHLQPGSYRIAVGMEGGLRPQRYTMAIGAAERFGIAEIPYVLGAISRIRARQY